MANRTCGNCRNFVKVKNHQHIKGGVCLAIDCNCLSDTKANNCKLWKAIPYNRKVVSLQGHKDAKILERYLAHAKQLDW